MIPLAGVLLVFAAVIGGFLLEHGEMRLLFQPAEFVIICGAAAGTTMVANPPRVLRGMWREALAVVRRKRFTREEYRETLQALYALFQFARKTSAAALDDILDHPEGSAAFRGASAVVRDREIREFVCDTLRTAGSGVVSAADLDRMLEQDIEIHEHGLSVPAESLGSLGETLPGLGIVAAVLGVLITMGAMGGSPKQVGVKVAAALVGTFLGILLSYGFVIPLADHIRVLNGEEDQYYCVLRAALVAHARGVTPRLAVEFARRTIPEDVRPEFSEMERVFRPLVRVIEERR